MLLKDIDLELLKEEIQKFKNEENAIQIEKNEEKEEQEEQDDKITTLEISAGETSVNSEEEKVV